jgi:hypothetical protein
LANYWPAWTKESKTYQVLGKWPETLWKQYKLSNATYEDYLFKARDGVPARKRNLDMCAQREEAANGRQAIEERTKRIRSNPDLYKPFPVVAEAQDWLALFKKDAMRYPILIALGPSQAGKTEWASSLFAKPLLLKIGDFDHFPDGMRKFDRGEHDGIVLDDLRDMRWLVRQQDKLQGKYNAELEFASTPGGQCAYTKDLFAVPIAVTANRSTLNLELLKTDDWLGNKRNRLVVHYTGFLEQQGEENTLAQPR